MFTGPPSATPVARPVDPLTVTMKVLLDPQVLRKVILLLFWSKQFN